jgi:hypothetical protein
MSKTRYSATFTLPDGSEYVLTRGSRQDYGYTVAWILVSTESGAVVAKGFSRTRQNAESATRGVWNDRIALYAPVTKNGGAS